MNHDQRPLVLATMLPYFVVIAMASTATVLFTGLWAMCSDDETIAGYSNLLMRWRVGMQGLTVALMALNFVLTGY